MLFGFYSRTKTNLLQDESEEFLCRNFAAGGDVKFTVFFGDPHGGSEERFELGSGNVERFVDPG